MAKLAKEFSKDRSPSSDSDTRRQAGLATLAPIIALASCVLYSLNGELLQFLQIHATSHASPMLNLILCHLGGLLFVPHFLFPASESRTLSQSRKEVEHVALLSLVLALILMGYNYAWLSSARYVAVGLTNAVFQTSVAFVFIAGVTLFHDTFGFPQILGVTFSLCGAAMASGVIGKDGHATTPHDVFVGLVLALLASAGLTLYQVLFKIWFMSKKNDARFLAHVGAWVSVWHVVVIFPMACLAHLTGFETMVLPIGSLAIFGTLLSAVIASTVNAMYLCLVMWGSSMLLPCASALSVPFMVFLDITMHQVWPGRLELFGHILVVLSVVLILDLYKYIMPSKPQNGGYLSAGCAEL